jgi:uncharacterized protein YjbI with pentapeptide repeats
MLRRLSRDKRSPDSRASWFRVLSAAGHLSLFARLPVGQAERAISPLWTIAGTEAVLTEGTGVLSVLRLRQVAHNQCSSATAVIKVAIAEREAAIFQSVRRVARKRGESIRRLLRASRAPAVARLQRSPAALSGKPGPPLRRRGAAPVKPRLLSGNRMVEGRVGFDPRATFSRMRLLGDAPAAGVARSRMAWRRGSAALLGRTYPRSCGQGTTSRYCGRPCKQDGCVGVPFETSGLCFRHTGDAERDEALATLRDGHALDFVGGVQFTPNLLREILDASRDDRARPVLRQADFRLATFDGDAELDGAIFDGDAQFHGAAFRGEASFDGATFQGGRSATFKGAIFESNASFRSAMFRVSALFTEARFIGSASFDDTTFEGYVSFDTVFERDAWFAEARFERARALGPMVVLGALHLERAAFRQPVNVEVSASRLALGGTRFEQGVHFRVLGAETVLDGAEFDAPSIVFGSEVWQEETAHRWRREGVPFRSERPRVVSVRGTDVSNLTLSDVDLQACRFANAHNLDQLQMEGTSLAGAPRPLNTRRKAIAEEHEWRATRTSFEGTRGWYPPECQFPSAWIGHPEQLRPHEIAAVYRALRKGREDNKDEPGAADFYYGEMEMRRHDNSTSLAERMIIWLYWLVSGYGLRGSRALASLAVTIIAFAILLHGWGFRSEESFGRALTFSAESTTSLFRVPEQPPLNLAGEWMQIGLRLLGPLFFGLALLSLRGRVKR